MLLLALLGGGLLLLLLLSAWVLHRSWGDFPSQPNYRLLEYSPPPRVASEHRQGTLPPSATPPNRDDDWHADPLAGIVPDHADLHGDHDGEYIQIHSPLLIQVIRRAQQQGNTLTRHVVDDGEHVYLALHTIPNPQERQRVAELIEAFQSGNHIGVWEMIDLMSQLGKGARPYR